MKRTPPSLSPNARPLLLVASGMLALLLAAQAFPTAVRRAFCAPSAWLSSQFLGAPMLPFDGGYRLECPALPVDVTLACSGTTFFVLLLGLLLLMPGANGASRRHTTTCSECGADVPIRLNRFARGARRGVAVLALAYVTTLAANTARIVLGWHAALWAHAVLPPGFHAGVHLAVGIVVFSGAMLAGVLLANWRPAHSRCHPEPRTLNPQPDPELS